MIFVPLNTLDRSFTYNGGRYTILNTKRNYYTGLWTFDLETPNGVFYGIPITSGTNVVRGLGTGLYKLVFIDNSTTNGEIRDLNQTDMIIPDFGDNL